jgi:hypothetical protein
MSLADWGDSYFCTIRAAVSMDSMDGPGSKLGEVRPIDMVGNVFKFQMDKETNTLVFKQKTGTFFSSTILNIKKFDAGRYDHFKAQNEYSILNYNSGRFVYAKTLPMAALSVIAECEKW